MRDSTFEATVLLYGQDPADFFRYLSTYGSSEWMPEKALWLAVLEDAYQCVRPRSRLLGHEPREGSRRAREAAKERDDARAWILCETEYVGSFRFVCDVLQLDADWVRQLIVSAGCQSLPDAVAVSRPARPGLRKI